MSVFALFVAIIAFAADEATLKAYYARANGKKAAALKTALYQCITAHTNIGYSGLWSAYMMSDRRDDGYLRDWYSNSTNYVVGGARQGASYKNEGDSYNREHLVPQDWFGSGDMKSDLVQVVPTDGYVNGRRSNYPLGENNGEKYTSNGGYCRLGICTVSGYSGICFEPNDEVKGDIARIYFYVMSCYENLHPGWNSGYAADVFDGKTYPGMKAWSLDMMLRWARNDTVDAVERARNEVVWELQGNRNPYVDYPDLCEYVWGTKTAMAFDLDNTTPVDPVDPVDPDDPVEPIDPDDPVNPEEPINPEEPTSGDIDLAQLTWTEAHDAQWGNGYSATANGLTLAYYTNTSANPVIKVGNELRLYKGSVFVISGDPVRSISLYGLSGYTSPLTIDGRDYTFDSNRILRWEDDGEGSDPVVIQALNKQVRLSSIGITLSRDDIPTDIDAVPEDIDIMAGAGIMDIAVYDIAGHYVGTTVPQRRGIYIIRSGGVVRRRLVQ